MDSPKFRCILAQIALQKHTTIEEVRKEMQIAIEAAQRNTDPATQALWASIPRKGTELTLEEFVSYMADKSRSTQA